MSMLTHPARMLLGVGIAYQVACMHLGEPWGPQGVGRLDFNSTSFNTTLDQTAPLRHSFRLRVRHAVSHDVIDKHLDMLSRRACDLARPAWTIEEEHLEVVQLSPKSGDAWLEVKGTIVCEMTATARLDKERRDQLLREVAAGHDGAVRIESTPIAHVFVDETHRGETPLVLRLAPGEHELAIEAAGYARRTTRLSVARGVVDHKDITLYSLERAAEVHRDRAVFAAIFGGVGGVLLVVGVLVAALPSAAEGRASVLGIAGGVAIGLHGLVGMGLGGFTAVWMPPVPDGPLLLRPSSDP